MSWEIVSFSLSLSLSQEGEKKTPVNQGAEWRIFLFRKYVKLDVILDLYYMDLYIVYSTIFCMEYYTRGIFERVSWIILGVVTNSRYLWRMDFEFKFQEGRTKMQIKWNIDVNIHAQLD